MVKDKKKKKDDKKSAGQKKAAKTARRLKAITQNPLVADVVAAALVATAAALKDSKKARQLAAQGADQLGKLSKEGASKGNAMWDLALDIGRRSLEALAGEKESGSKRGK
ncbi:hypothetical protein [Sphingomonas sp. URHD0057]|uniref:hypothetical protein n=1 Tax=Sphingomonas sp. URHD0057 TaxID=1380389 RepID=UPI0004902C57|nr:hypothetical protein [Sphingomonas sp. URHD0057]